VSSAWIGLAGVVVGGVIATLWSWLAVVRQELADAVVAARLVDEDLRTIESASPGTARPAADVWTANRVALAKVLGETQWHAVSDVYRQGGAGTSPDEDPALRTRVDAARGALEPLVRGKRYVTRQRAQNWLGARSRASRR
jgi:hypothetical protein